MLYRLLLCFSLFQISCGKHVSNPIANPFETKPTVAQAPVTQSIEERVITAIQTEDLNEISIILAKGFAVNTPILKGRTALHLAVESNKPRIIIFLIENGANPELIDDEGKSSKDLAFGNPSLEILLTSNSSGLLKSRLMQAISEGDHEKVKSFIEDEKQDPNFVDEKMGETPLTLSIRRSVELQSNSTVRILLKKSSATDPNLKNKKGQTPLSLARELGSLEIIKWLKMKGAQEE